jgi:hypothetical protein
MTMAELTTLEEKLAEVLGLAQAAQGATEKVEDEGIVSTLRQMREEAEETERRCRFRNGISTRRRTAPRSSPARRTHTKSPSHRV